jgi:hypothetical protein
MAVVPAPAPVRADSLAGHCYRGLENGAVDGVDADAGVHGRRKSQVGNGKVNSTGLMIVQNNDKL